VYGGLVSRHEVRVAPLPTWLDAQRLLGPTKDGDGGWAFDACDGGIQARASLDGPRAADLAARVRGLGLDGRPLTCEIEPPLRRALVRRARTEDARRRRTTTPGFSRAGARVDEIGRMSLTPEILADRVASWAGGRAVVDAGCGVGGNAIAFARAGSRVCAIEIDADRLALARDNARLYGVADRVEFVLGDARELVRARADPETILFVDPPWGADWNRRGCGLAELPLLAALRPLAAGYHALWAKLPPSFATAELGGPEIELRVDALFGEAEGDRRRVKFVLARVSARSETR
jgi:hypothetical protein